MNTEQEGSFRTRTGDDGSLEVWARGWRLESQLYALIPMALSLMFLVAPMSITMRAVGAVVMLGATFCVFRMTKPGLRLTEDAVSIVSVVRTQRFPWEQVSGFMGERRHDEGRVHLILADERHIPLPGTLDPAELDPYGDEGELLSAADQLNRLQERALAQDLPKPAAPVVHTVDRPLDDSSRRDRRSERKALRAPLKAVPLTPESTPERVSAPHAPNALPDDATRKEQRRERKALRAALKAVRLTSEGTVVQEAAGDEVPTTTRRSGRRSRRDPTPELVEVPIGDPETPPGPPARTRPQPPPLNSNYPTPVYIPQAEYAQMLREQKAAEKAAVAAAAELRRLAQDEEIDELALKQGFSDWTP
jgi:PH (Pleckstrin Homology) domain-containing protein